MLDVSRTSPFESDIDDTIGMLSSTGIVTAGVVSAGIFERAPLSAVSRSELIPGYGTPEVFMTFQPMTVPSLAYRNITGEGGSSVVSPEAPAYCNGLLAVRSCASPKRTVSFISLSRGTEGVDVSSKEKLHHVAVVDEASTVLPMRPMSEEVLSPTNNKNLLQPQLRNVRVKAPGGRIPGNGRYGVRSLIS